MNVHPELARKDYPEHVADKLRLTVGEASQAIIRLVNHNMARAISIVSVERGRDPREYTLFSFGGAGPLHACDLAEEMSITRVMRAASPWTILGIRSPDGGSSEDVFDSGNEHKSSITGQDVS